MKKELELVKQLVKELHKGQVDKAGVNYYEGHLTAVARPFVEKNDLVCACVAYLHDSIEDVEGFYEEDLRNHLYEIFEDEEKIELIVNGVVAITKLKGKERYSDYLARVKNNPIATRVKLADYAHNMDLSRLEKVTEKDLERQEKYVNGVAYLKGEL